MSKSELKIQKTYKMDLRIRKTHKALYDAIFTMLGRRNFNDITVNDLCAEALVSRATFYAHFRDKYDFLNFFLTETRKSIARDVHNYNELEREINRFAYSNKKEITNILKDANGETLALIRKFIASIVELVIKRKSKTTGTPNQIILFNFLTGGLLNLLTWAVENNFPPEIKLMNLYLYKMLEAMTIWDAQQEEIETHTEN